MTEHNSDRQQSLYEVTGDREKKAKHYVQMAGIIPFAGINAPVSYPDVIDEDMAEASHRFDREEPLCFEEAVDTLPEATKVQAYADNQYAAQAEDGDIEYDVEKMRQVDGINLDEIADKEGKSIEELLADSGARDVFEVGNRQVVADDRRQVLKTLGWRTKAEWQVASNLYTPLKVNKFFSKKTSELAQANMLNGFGWIRYRAYGGETTITTIYPSRKQEVEVADKDDVSERTARDEDERSRLTALDDEDVGQSKVAFYGDQVRYNFKGNHKLKVRPVVFFPESNMMVPVPTPEGNELVRKQMGTLMEDIDDHHEEVIDKITEFTKDINQNIMEARRLAIDFSECEFATIADFYEYIGIDSQTYAENAAERVKDFAADNQVVSVWNLQLQLKRTLIEDYDGDKAAGRYHTFQQIAGQLLQYPDQQLKIAVAEYYKDKASEDEETDAEQVDFSDFNPEDYNELTEGDLTPSEAQRVQEAVESQLE